MNASRRAVAVLVLLLASSCDRSSGGGEDMYFPTYHREPGGALPLGELHATLAVSSRCIVAEADAGGTYIPLWPEGWSPQLEEGVVMVADDTGRVVATEGAKVHFGGGGRSVEIAEEFYDLEVPDYCGTGLVWLVAGVLS
jgi:hypothetical protein